MKSKLTSCFRALIDIPLHGSDLTTRLEETNVRMKKLSEVFTTCEETFSDTEPGPHPRVTDGENETFQPLVRTTRIVSGKSPLDDVVEKMIQTPDQKSSTVSSVMNCPLNSIFPSHKPLP